MGLTARSRDVEVVRPTDGGAGRAYGAGRGEKGHTMLEETIDAIEAIADRFGDGSIMNSNNTPAPGRTGVGTATSTASGSTGNSSPPNRNRDRNRTTDRDTSPNRDRDSTPDHDQPDYESSLQKENAAWTSVDAALTAIGHFFKGAGTKVLGPLMPAIQASDTVAEGVTTVSEYHDNKWDRINEQTGGYFESQGRGGSGAGANAGSGRYDRWNP